MAFDKTQPTDTTKIRNLGVVIRPNWVAIEEGDSTFKPFAVNFQNRTPLAVGNDPTTIADTSIFYVKDDGAGNPEAYIKDGSGNIMQISEGGALGAVTTAVNGLSLSFDSTLTYDQTNMVTAKGHVTGAGAGSGLFNCTTAGGSGQYTITFTNAMADTTYQVLATANMNGANHQRICCTRNKLVGSFQVTIRRSDQSSSFEAEEFDFIVVGGR